MIAFFQFLIRLDRSVFHAVNGLAGGNQAVDWMIRFGADDHIIPTVLALLVLATLLLARKHSGRETALRAIICALAATLVSTVILYGLNNLFFRPRPFTTQAVHMLFYHNTDSAFPSNAATLAFALSFGVFMYRRKQGSVMLAIASLMCLARVAAGIHYPGDVIAGMLLALGGALLARAAEPAYAPLAARLNRGLDRFRAAWRPARRPGPKRSVEP